MRVETLIGGTMVEKRFLSLYGGDGSSFSLCYVLDFQTWVCKILHPWAVQQGDGALEHQGNLGRESLSLPKGRMRIELHFPQSGIGHNYIHHLQRQLCSREDVVLLGAAKEELMESFLACYFSGGVIYSLEELQRRLSSFISTSLALGQVFIISH